MYTFQAETKKIFPVISPHKLVKMLKELIDVVMLCGKQNFALRGHREENSNFLTLLQFRAKTDPFLACHLNSDESRAIPKYTSPDIQNEPIELCGDYLRKLLLQNCNSASFFAFLADEATHSGMKEQISICVRFVHRKEGENKVEVRENFLWLVEAESTRRVALAEKFMNTLNEFGIDIHKMRAQGYDGAANMSGVHKGSTGRHTATGIRGSVLPL